MRLQRRRSSAGGPRPDVHDALVTSLIPAERVRILLVMLHHGDREGPRGTVATTTAMATPVGLEPSGRRTHFEHYRSCL